MRESCVRVKVCALWAVAILAGTVAIPGLGADLVRGQAVYQLWCADCHAASGGRYLPPAGYTVLQKRYQGNKPAAISWRTDLTATYIKLMVRNGLNVMPRTRKTEVSDADLDNLAAYLTAPIPDRHADADLMGNYYGNTLISHHEDGGDYLVQFDPDRTFRVTHDGKPVMNGTYVLDDAKLCMIVNGKVFECPPFRFDQAVGERWDALTPTGHHDILTLQPGR